MTKQKTEKRNAKNQRGKTKRRPFRACASRLEMDAVVPVKPWKTFETDRRWPLHAINQAATVPDDFNAEVGLVFASEKRPGAAAPGMQDTFSRGAPSWCGCPQAAQALC
ncbi:MAG: hypothetical protein PSV40_17565 [Polaromonas sp.]|uniref:hypothetical protein n=1 Tax=Polaromonas sp. TaxID=1869339 RepID=UPI0024896C75|nr:hypothetical protein [Polaromonas sp.]MDI1270894.1 hypothetical protein [Polaromonas sp.]